VPAFGCSAHWRENRKEWPTLVVGKKPNGKYQLMRTLAFGVVLLLGVVSCCSCASVRVYKVDVDRITGKETVNEDVEGIPYYVPRPYLEIYDPFVISAKPYFVTAQLTPDGKYLRLMSLPKGLDKLDELQKLFEVKPYEAEAQVVTTRSAESPFQGAIANAAAAATNAAAGTGTTSKSSDDSSKKPSDTSPATNAPPAKSTVATQKVVSTADYYLTPGRRFFDIVYLPDYSDKRVIQIRGGLGKSDLSVALAQGWSLSALNASVDNTEMAKLLTQTVTTLLEVGKKAAETTLFPPAGVLQGSVVENPVLITCKLTVSTMVAPGIYPMPKEVELPGPYQKRNARSIVDMLGLVTYDVYTVQALTPTGDSPLNFTPYGSAPKVGAGGPTPTTFDKAAVKQELMAAFSGVNGKYKDTVKDVSIESGSAPDKIILTVTLSKALNSADEPAAKKELTAEGNAAIKADKVTIEDIKFTVAPASNG
jgi:hypothetical protein